MAVQRGAAYWFDGLSPGTVGVLVLSNDDWNEIFGNFIAVPISREPVDLPYVVSARMEKVDVHIVSGRLVALSQFETAREVYRFEPEQMERVEDGVCDVLGLREILRDPPESPPAPFGVLDVPRWSEIHWGGPAVADEVKRRLVVSNDYWNAQSGTPVTVRTTTSSRRYGPEFPTIENGQARACCGEATFLPPGTFDVKARRPTPSSLGLTDMRAVARGLVDVLDLRGAVERLDLGRWWPQFGTI